MYRISYSSNPKAGVNKSCLMYNREKYFSGLKMKVCLSCLDNLLLYVGVKVVDEVLSKSKTKTNLD